DLVTNYKNYGSGASDGLTGVLFSADPDVVVSVPMTTITRINSMQELAPTTRFRLKENVIAENPITIVLTDNHSRSLTSNITLRGPAAAAKPVLDASTGANVIQVSWTPSTDADLAGYHVYRSASVSGPWPRVTQDCLGRVAYFRNTGLAPSTLYYYRVTAVDSSGNEGAPSPSSFINTNPAQLSGWPIPLGASSSCTAAVGDITGDGQKELVAGNDHLYAWSA